MAKSLFSSKKSQPSTGKGNSQKGPRQGSVFNKPLFSKSKKQELDVFDFENDDNLALPDQDLGRTPGSKGKRPVKKAPRPKGGAASKKGGSIGKKVNPPYTWFGKPLKGNLMAIDFDDHEVRLLVARQRRQDLEIIASARGILQNGIVHNGDIVDINSLIDVIRQLVRANRLDATYAFFSADNTDIIVRPVSVSTNLTKAEDIEGAVSFELQQYLDIDPSAYNIEYQDSGSAISAGMTDSASRLLMVYAVPKRTIDQYLEIAEALKLTPYVFDLRSNSLEKWVERIESVNNRARRLVDQNIGIIQVKSEKTSVYLYSKGGFVTSNHVNRGYAKVEQFATTPEQIQNIGAIASGQVSDSSIKTALDEWLSDVGGHVLNTENFFTTQTGEYIHQFYVFGDDNYCRQLTPILKSKLGREFEAISTVDCHGLNWSMGTNFTADFIPAAAMLIRRSN